MTELHIAAQQAIEAPAAVVRKQFADVAHHAATSPHRGVRFVVLTDDATCCRYEQITSLGPIRLHQTIELDRNATGPLVNRIVAGQFVGGTISFDIEAAGPNDTLVTARLDAPLRGMRSLLAPMLRRQVGRALRAALDEDRDDIESGRYPAAVLQPASGVSESR